MPNPPRPAPPRPAFTGFGVGWVGERVGWRESDLREVGREGVGERLHKRGGTERDGERLEREGGRLEREGEREGGREA